MKLGKDRVVEYCFYTIERSVSFIMGCPKSTILIIELIFN